MCEVVGCRRCAVAITEAYIRVRNSLYFNFITAFPAEFMAMSIDNNFYYSFTYRFYIYDSESCNVQLMCITCVVKR